MKRLVDVVNFNADASCLDAGAWLNSLKGGKASPFYRWLNTYVVHRKKVVLGLVGATVADMAVLNPETIDLINRHPKIFQLIYRPYIHDIGLLRSPGGFELNIQLGRRILNAEFRKIVPFFLPPEFMVTSDQIRLLEKFGMAAIFINASRFSEDIQQQIPSEPYIVKGVLNSSLICVPCNGRLTSAFLDSLYGFEASPWNETITRCPGDRVFAWRDGESAFLIPDGIEREENWLRSESSSIGREFLPGLESLGQVSIPLNSNGYYSSYPVHSFSRWMKEFRMLGYIHRVQEIETHIDQLKAHQLALWFQTINSDVLSAVEKPSHRVRLAVKGWPTLFFEHIIRRSERGFEGEDYLALLEACLKGQTTADIEQSSAAHIEKVRVRSIYLKKVIDEHRHA